VVPGFAVTEEPVVELRLVAGSQLYVFAPLAVKTIEEPAQIVAVLTVSAGVLTTATVDVAEAVQLPIEPVTT
jgi:hypothetical protein